MKIKKEFAANVFDKTKAKRYLSKKIQRELSEAIDGNKPISPQSAEKIAKALRKWAVSRGATRFAHWFQPLNNSTAGKRDCLCSINENGLAIYKFNGKELLKGESDASSFPSGGLRQTFEARGITRWDCLSHPYVNDGCLFIPTTFTTFNGETLDKKTPLLRSCAALNVQALRLLRILGFPFAKVQSVVGAEQEYFLIDKEKYLKRPDLVFCGRTLWGKPNPKGQELCDHYYRPPDAKILAFWSEVDSKLWKLGIIAKTEHKEVAPSQFELAPCYQPINIACDQNQIIMQTLQTVADKFGMVCLLHEKPFEGVNGSGKHNNWSLMTDDGTNLFECGKTAHERVRFAIIISCIVRAMSLHSDLMRLAVAGASNDCRLGGYEAPPQTFSIYLGELYDTLKNAAIGNWRPNTDLLPNHIFYTDRNRTSPFAFTGNKFEFRTVGSSASIADCNTILNTAVADAMSFFSDKLENSKEMWETEKNLIRETFENHSDIIYNGNNYSAEWKYEAEKRHLPNITESFSAIKCLTDSKNIKLFDDNKVLCERELVAIQTILWENYAETIELAAKVICKCLHKMIYPLQRYLLLLNQIVDSEKVNAANYLEKAEKISCLIEQLYKTAEYIESKTTEYTQRKNIFEKAKFAAEVLVPLVSEARNIANNAEACCPSELWAMPTYAELLF